MKSAGSFKQFVKEENDSGVVLFWGRCNPPTIGHEHVFNTAASIANQEGWPLKIYLTHTRDNKKNPLSYNQKFSAIEQLFPRYSRYLVRSELRTITQVLKSLEASYSHVKVVVGEDREEYFQSIFNKYNGKDYEYSSLVAVSSGKRDPESESVDGMSSSKMRSFATEEDLNGFSSGLPAGTPVSLVKKLFRDVRKGLGLLKESRKTKFMSTPERERFYNGSLVRAGDVVSTKEILEARVVRLGANFVVLEKDGEHLKCWPKDIVV